MLIVFPIAPHEREAATRIASWVKEIGAGVNHDALLILQKDGACNDLVPLFADAFKSARSYSIPMDAGNGWNPTKSYDATTANNMFYWGSLYCDEVLHRPFLWHECDAVPTRKTSYDEIEAEYKACGKPFMGCLINSGPMPNHMSGVAVYPDKMPQHSITIRNCGTVAWDLASAKEVLPKAHFSELIQHHHWGGKPCRASEDWNGRSALFHQCKCGCIYNRLKADANIMPSYATNPAWHVASHEFNGGLIAPRKITDKDHIAALTDIAAKDPLAKARIVKMLAKAGFHLTKKRKPCRKKLLNK